MRILCQNEIKTYDCRIRDIIVLLYLYFTFVLSVAVLCGHFWRATGDERASQKKEEMQCADRCFMHLIIVILRNINVFDWHELCVSHDGLRRNGTRYDRMQKNKYEFYDFVGNLSVTRLCETISILNESVIAPKSLVAHSRNSRCYCIASHMVFCGFALFAQWPFNRLC